MAATCATNSLEIGEHPDVHGDMHVLLCNPGEGRRGESRVLEGDCYSTTRHSPSCVDERGFPPPREKPRSRRGMLNRSMTCSRATPRGMTRPSRQTVCITQRGLRGYISRYTHDTGASRDPRLFHVPQRHRPRLGEGKYSSGISGGGGGGDGVGGSPGNPVKKCRWARGIRVLAIFPLNLRST